MDDIFSIETRKYMCFCDIFIDADGCEFDKCQNVGHVKQWKYVRLNLKGLHPIPRRKEMHSEDDVV